MKFRTELKINPFTRKIGYSDRILALGSCFTEHIAARMEQLKFHITANPTGILFNPSSISESVRTYALHKEVTRKELHSDHDLWFHYAFHGDFSRLSPEEALLAMNAARDRAAEALSVSNTLLITWGTSWVYERDGHIVANCHRQPAREFTRHRLSVEEIVEDYTALIQNELQGKHIILTVSPVRHIGDGLSGNNVSKSTLRLAAEILCERFPEVDYFPSYEALIDDLRDYRYYADDLVHPSTQAVAYIWELFSEAVLDDHTRELIPQIEAVLRMAAHRPRNPHAEEYQKMVRRALDEIDRLKEINFERERAAFLKSLEINL